MNSNSSNGDLYGGIYASHVAAKLRVSPQPNDPILPDRYLDFKAMHSHEYIVNRARGYEYNLTFGKYTPMPVTLPTPALFDFQARQHYYVLEEEVREYNATVEATRLAEEAARNASTSYHFNHFPDYQW